MNNLNKLLLIILVLSSCRYEDSTNTSNFITNNTAHKITLTPYHNGIADNNNIVNINSKESKMVLENNNLGKGTGYTYASDLAIKDSTYVLFDDTILEVHYSFKESSNNIHSTGIKSDSNRSIYNENNYIRQIKSENKHNISNEYTFTFTEQDYLDAKNK